MRQALQVALVALGNLATTSLAFVASGPAVRPKWALPLVGCSSDMPEEKAHAALSTSGL
jgi:hypothetical protein